MSDCPMTRSIRRKFLRFSIGRTLNEAIWILWENKPYSANAAGWFHGDFNGPGKRRTQHDIGSN